MIPEIEYYKLASKDLKKLREMIYEMERKMMTERFNKFIEENYDTKNTKNEQQKDLCITSEQLTEQWKNGDLPAGDYWCEITESPYIEKVYLTKGEDFVVKILAPVPSYEEWKAAYEYEKYADNEIKNIKVQNAVLKELLKECRLAVFDYPPYDLASDKIRLTNKIDEVLK